jgi:tetratricopeptide (TPR) repeat protein
MKAEFYHFFAGWSEQVGGSNFWDFVSWGSEKYEQICQELPNLLLSLTWAYENKEWADVLALAKVIVHPIYYQGQLNKRLQCSEYGLLAAKNLNDVEDIIWFNIQGFGSIHLLRGDYPNTEKYLKQGIKLAKKHNFPNAVALGETYLGYMDLQQGHLAEAQKHIDLALTSAQDPLFRYRAHHAAGHIARYLEQYDEAGEYYLKSAKFLQEATFLASSDVWLGFTKLGQQKYEKAAEYFRRYLETHRNSANQRVLGMAKLGMARYTEVQQEMGHAVTYAKEAHEILSAINAHWELIQVTQLLERLS